MDRTDAAIDQLTETIIGCGIELHRFYGPGLLESVYEQCLIIELRLAHLEVESGRRLGLEYKGHTICRELKLDLADRLSCRTPAELQRANAKGRAQTSRSPRSLQKENLLT
jgi:hypothetical protein